MRPIGQRDRLSPALLLRAYALGVFPMARDRDDPCIQWVAPMERGILPLERFRVPRRLRRTVRQERFTVRCNSAFADVIAACAAPGAGRTDTWINREIERAFVALHDTGHAHSVEAWLDDRLVGGLYGVSLGSAFFGESMFSLAPDASKVSLVHLVARMRLGGYTLLDTQFVTPHLRQFGAIEIPAATYLARLDRALRQSATFYSTAESASAAASAAASRSAALRAAVAGVLRQSSTQTS